MPYNTRRKSLSLPSLGIHVPISQAARAAAAAAAAASKNPPSRTSSSPAPSSSSNPSEPMDSPPNKRMKRSHSDPAPAEAVTTEQAPSSSQDSTQPPNPNFNREINLSTINDDIVEAVVTQLQRTVNRPHLIKELALVLALQLRSVQNSANQCAIISSRLASYMKRPCWTADETCPIAKELEPVHPRRTYYYLTTLPRQPLPDPNSFPTLQPRIQQPKVEPQSPPSPQLIHDDSLLTPSVSLTDDSASDDLEIDRRILSPSPEVELSSPEFDDFDDDFDLGMPATPIGSLPKTHARDYSKHHSAPPLEKDEREFSQTANVLQKRKWKDSLAPSDLPERIPSLESGYREDMWFSDTRTSSIAFLTSPLIKPSGPSSARKDDDAEAWAKLNKLIEWDQGAETIEIDELDCLLDMC